MKNYPLFITSDKSEYSMFNFFLDHEKKVMPLPAHLGEIPYYVNGKQYNFYMLKHINYIKKV